MNSKFVFIVILFLLLLVFNIVKVRIRYLIFSKIIFNVIFVGIFKLLFFVFESLIYNVEIGNVNKIMNSGFIDWN